MRTPTVLRRILKTQWIKDSWVEKKRLLPNGCSQDQETENKVADGVDKDPGWFEVDDNGSDEDSWVNDEL